MKDFIKIFIYAKPYKVKITISIICSTLFVLMNAISLWLISSLLSTILNPNKSGNSLIKGKNETIQYFENLTNNLIGYGNGVEQLKILCILMLLTFLLKNVFFYLSNTTMSYVNNKMIMNIRNEIFSHLQNLPVSFFHNNKVGEISSITMGDAARMRVAVSTTVNQLTKQPLNIIVMLIMLFLINVKMTLYSLIIIPLISLVVIKIGQSIRRKTIKASKLIAGIISILHENLSGIEVVKSFSKENKENEKFQKEAQKHFNLIYKQAKLGSILTPVNDMIGVSIAILLLWIGGQEVFVYNNLDPDSFIKFIVYLFAMLQPIKSLAGVNISIQSSIASAQRAFSILNFPKQIDTKDAIEIKKFNSTIKFNDVDFSYNNNTKILNNINFTIPKGQVYAIVGKSGSGKSTLVNLLPRFYEISDGDILLDDKSISNVKISSLRKMIGIVSQDTFLFNTTIAENISYGQNNKTKEDIINVAKSANAHEFIMNLDSGYETIIGERGVKLSGGQKQRISIARALLKNPSILIFDEATSSLDTESENEVQKAIENLLIDRTVIVIAHRLSTIINSDQIIVIDKGEIIERGSHKQLLKLDGKYKQLHDLQFKNGQ